jgi:hypothetical protein
LLECGVVGDLLHSAGESVDVAVGDDEALLAVGVEVFGAGGGSGENGASASQGLTLNESETLFNAGQNEQVAGAHLFCDLGLRENSDEDDVVGGQRCEKAAHVILNAADDGETLLRMLQTGEGLEQIGNSFADADLAGEEDFKGVSWRVFGSGEVIKSDAVGYYVNFFGREAHLQK